MRRCIRLEDTTLPDGEGAATLRIHTDAECTTQRGEPTTGIRYLLDKVPSQLKTNVKLSYDLRVTVTIRRLGYEKSATREVCYRPGELRVASIKLYHSRN